MSDIKKSFEDAVNYVKTTEASFNPGNDLKLEMYGLYKQATEGDVSGSRPGMMQMVNRAKYDAWAKLKGTSQEEAMQKYMDIVEGVKDRNK